MKETRDFGAIKFESLAQSSIPFTAKVAATFDAAPREWVATQSTAAEGGRET
jgi:hypothetical protein